LFVIFHVPGPLKTAFFFPFFFFFHPRCILFFYHCLWTAQIKFEIVDSSETAGNFGIVESGCSSVETVIVVGDIVVVGAAGIVVGVVEEERSVGMVVGTTDDVGIDAVVDLEQPQIENSNVVEIVVEIAAEIAAGTVAEIVLDNVADVVAVDDVDVEGAFAFAERTVAVVDSVFAEKSLVAPSSMHLLRHPVIAPLPLQLALAC